MTEEPTDSDIAGLIFLLFIIIHGRRGRGGWRRRRGGFRCVLIDDEPDTFDFFVNHIFELTSGAQGQLVAAFEVCFLACSHLGDIVEKFS